MPASSTASEPSSARGRVRGDSRPKRRDHPPKPRQASRNTSLAFQQAKELINSLAYAESLLPEAEPWAHITIALEQSEDFEPAPRAYLALQGRILKAIKRRLKQLHLPEHYLWLREEASFGEHSHVLIRLPPEHRAELELLIRKTGKLRDISNNRAVVITPERDRATGKPDTRGMHTRAQRSGVMLDWLKTMAPRAQHDRTPIMQALGVRHRAPCTIHGKRCGTSANLGRADRAAAGWKDLETDAELRAALGGVIQQARKDRARRKKLRQRVRRAAATVPPSCTQPSYQPSDNLADDFFE